MALYLVATPIGHPNDITLRGLETLKSADAIILEERKEGTQFLRHHEISGKEYFKLNEHSTPADLKKLLDLCRTKKIALITDCGTPGFADPGADLVRLCRAENIEIQTLPGSSSLMALLSLSSRRLNEFVFRGFLSAETDLRRQQWQTLKSEKKALVLMDTPYRLEKIVNELGEFFPNRECLLTLNLTQENEHVLEGLPSDIKKKLQVKKAEFMLLIYPS